MLKSIKSNSTIGVISPAWIPLDGRMKSGLQYLENRGFNIKTGKNLGKVYGYFAGTDKERLDDIHEMFADPEIDMIVCARGGWGGLRLVDNLDYDLIQKNPKLFIGYSDITTLQLAIWTKTSVPSISGPMVGVEMGKGILPFTEKHFLEQIHNENPVYRFNYQETDTLVLKDGKTDGVLLGGCLSLVCHLIGTPYSPDYSGAILFLEDVGEKPYKIDRYLAHLKQAGIFDQINGLILGDFIDCDADEGEVSFHLDEILDEYFTGASYPVLRNFPYGHGDFKFSMPVGVNTILDTDRGELSFANPFID
jgi:muramoyltetrapeptide carboxypeptidase